VATKVPLSRSQAERPVFFATQEKSEEIKMTIALTVVLNIAAVAGLLVLLTATLRLPYYLPSTPRADLIDGRTKDRAQQRSNARPAGRRTSERHDVPEVIYSQ
jgi:hypothetical protein